MAHHSCLPQAALGNFAADSQSPMQGEAEIFVSLHFVYILVCRDGTFYTGYTNNLLRRLKAHNGKHGAKYTRSRQPVYLVYHEVFLDQHQAMSREYTLKKLTRAQKLECITSQICCLTSFRLKFDLSEDSGPDQDPEQEGEIYERNSPGK